LPDFQFIFFWEWFHRLWARLIGVVFAVGFILLLSGRHFKKSMVGPLVILFLLGALQGAVGWIMVKSGLSGDAIYVKPTRLALHFVFALGLLCYTWWFTLQLQWGTESYTNNNRLRSWVMGLLALLIVQLAFGALMAGHKAATAAATWPTINGAWWPFTDKQLAWKDVVNNPILIHFIHRLFAYILLIGIVCFTVQLYKNPLSKPVAYIKNWAAVLVFIQVLLGILSLIASKGIIPGKWGWFEWLAQIHQLTGMALLLLMVKLLYLIRPVTR
jgi:cytochrome c oxidase assembly protein subunit 15